MQKYERERVDGVWYVQLNPNVFGLIIILLSLKTNLLTPSPKGTRLLHAHIGAEKHTKTYVHMHAILTAKNDFHSISLSHKHTHTNGSQVLWIIQWNKSKHNNICTQIQTPESSHGLWPSKHRDKEQTTLTDMQKSYTRPHQKVVLGMVLPWLRSVKATKTCGALVRPENLMQKCFVCSDSTLGASVHIIILNIKICTHVNN